MDVGTLLGHRHQKFRILGGFVEGQPVDPEKKRNMKKKETDLSQATADIEAEIENIKKAALEAKGKSPAPTISDEAVEKLRQEVDKEMTNAFISMGLQEKLEALKMELSKSGNSPDQTLGPVLKEKVDRLMQEFKHNLSRPGSYMALKQKLEMLSEVSKLQELRLKGEKLKKELNEKLQEQVKDKIEILRKAREQVAKGEKLEEEAIKEVEKVKKELEEMLKSMNLEVVGLTKKKVSTAPPVLEKKLKKADEVIKSEIEKVIDMIGLRGKIDELKAEISSGLNKEKIEQLDKEIREEIAAAVDLNELKRKVETEIKEENDGSSADAPLQETVGAGKASG